MSEFKRLIGSVKKVETDTSDAFYKSEKPAAREVLRRKTTKKQAASTADSDMQHMPISTSHYDIGIEERVYFHRDGIQKNVMKKLGQGELSPIETIDLHGMTTLEAEQYLSDMINTLQLPYQICIKIIHGKGYHAGDEPLNKPAPVLKNFTVRFLQAHPRVLAFCSCPTNRGGTGAVYVLLQKNINKSL